MKSIKYNINLEPKMVLQLKQIANTQSRMVSDLVREALAKIISEYSKDLINAGEENQKKANKEL